MVFRPGFNFAQLPVQQPHYPDLAQALARGWQFAKMPEQYAEQQALQEQRIKGQQLANALKSEQMKNLPGQMDLNKRYKEAQIQAMMQPKQFAPDPFVKALEAQNQVNQVYGVDSPQAVLMKQRIQRMAEGAPGFSFTTDKEGNVSLTQGNQPIQKNLPKGYQVWKDAEGKPAGYLIPSSEADLKEHKGRTFFNHVQPVINRGLSQYSGRSAEIDFARDAKNYDADPAAQKRIDDFLLARELMAAGLVKENATLGGSNTRYGYKTLEATLNSSNLLPIIEQAGTKLLPRDAKQKAGERLNEIINDASKRSTENLPAYKRTYFHPPEKKEVRAKKRSQDLDVTRNVEKAANTLSLEQLDALIAQMEKKKG